VRRVYQFAPRPDRAFYFNVPIDVSVSRILSGRAKLKDYEAGMDLNLAPDPVASYKIFQSRILNECTKITHEYGLTEIDATQSIGEQQMIVRQMVDETLSDYVPQLHEQPRTAMEMGVDALEESA
jgi:dTMP kinase